MKVTPEKNTKLKQAKKSSKEISSSKKLNAKKYLGIIKLQKDPLTIQKELREEWALDS